MTVFALMAQESGGQIQEIARTFGVDWPHLTAQIISFGIVCALLYWLAYQPVLRMLDERRRQIALGLENTDKINAALAGIEAQRQGVLTDAQAQSTKLIAEARDIATRLREQEAQRAIAAAEQIVRQAREAAAQEHARMLGRASSRSRPAGRADDGRGHREGADAGRSAPAGGRNGQGADDLVARVDRMKTAKQAQREARQLFRLCLVNGSLDESRARRVVQRLVDAAGPGRCPSCRAFSAWCGSIARGTAPM